MQNRNGFTLIEIAIALTVFLLFTGVILSSVLHIIQVQIEANRYRALYSELNDVVELISTDTKEYAIDYSCFEPGQICDFALPGDTVAFLAPNLLERSVLRIEPVLDNNDLVAEFRVSYEIQKRTNLQQPWPAFAGDSLFSELGLIRDYKLAVFPETDPYSPTADLRTQDLYHPQLQFGLDAVLRSQPNRANVPIQTVISSRAYNIRSN